MSLHLGLDLGGTNIKAAVVDSSLRVLATETCPTRAGDGEEAVLERVASVGRAVVAPFGEPASAGLALPGHFDAATGAGLAAAEPARRLGGPPDRRARSARRWACR